MKSLNSYFLTTTISDVSTAKSVFLPIPDGGEIVKIDTILQGAIASVDAELTFEIGGTAMTNSAITVAFTSSAAGDHDSSKPSALNTVLEGGALEIITDGGSTNAVDVTVTVEISRTAK